MDLKVLTLLALLAALASHGLSSPEILIQTRSKLPRLVCRVAYDLKRKEPDANSIAIASLDSKVEAKWVDEIVECMPKTVVVKVMDSEAVKNGVTATDANLVVLLADSVDKPQLMSLTNTVSTTTTFKFTAKFLIVTSEPRNRNAIASVMTACNILNFGVIYEADDGEPTVLTTNQFLNTAQTQSKVKRSQLIDTIYPDKLANLHRHAYRGVVHLMMAHKDATSGEVTTKYLYFLRAIAGLQNASLELTELSSERPKVLKKQMQDIMTSQSFDLILFEISRLDEFTALLATREDNAICALVPWAHKSMDSFQLLLDVQKGSNMLIISLAIVAMLIVWRLYKNRGANSSLGRVAMSLWAPLIDQSLSLGKNRLVLTIMLQLFVVAMFFHSMVLNAVFSSLVTVPPIDASFKTFEELFASSEKFVVEMFCDAKMNEDADYERAKASGRVDVEHIISNYQITNPDSIVITRCSLAKVHERSMSELIDAQYIMPERIHAHYNHLEAGYRNAFLARMQLFMDWSFEAGLPQIWEAFHEMKVFGVAQGSAGESDDEMLRWKQIRIAFYQLAIGLTMATVAFVCEILAYYHRNGGWLNILRLTLTAYVRKRDSRRRAMRRRLNLGKKKSRNPMRLRARRVQVRPAGDEMV